MKNVFKVSLLAATVALTVGCNDDTSVVSFENTQDKAAYAIGTSFASYLYTTLEKQAEMGMELDKEIILQGITDKLRDNSQMTEEDMLATLKAYDVELQAASEKHKMKLAEKRDTEATEFLDENAKKPGVKVTESGLQYLVKTKGKGATAALKDTVSVHYVGTLTDGTEFDSSVKRGEPAVFPLDRVIPGWTEGVQLMNVGSKYQFVIPANLAYGEQGAGSIPPGATLIFDVELLAINPKTASAKK